MDSFFANVCLLDEIDHLCQYVTAVWQPNKYVVSHCEFTKQKCIFLNQSQAFQTAARGD